MKNKRNNVLTEARKKLNISQTEFAEKVGTSVSFYNAIERLKYFPNKKEQEKISKYFINNGVCLFEDELFPEELYEIEKPNVEFLSLDELEENEIPYEENQVVEEMNSEHLKNGIDRVLKTLPKKYKQVVTAYFGLNDNEESSLEDISNALEQKVTRERVRQIKDKALKRMWGRLSF